MSFKLYEKSEAETSDILLFKNSTNEYRAAPFWAWNTKLNKNELLRQIDCLEEMGFGVFYIHSRTGLDTTYLGDKFMHLVSFCIEKAKEQGMIFHIYDEGRFSSGAAVVVLCFCDQRKTTFRDIHLKIAKHYDLSVVSMVDSIYSLVESGQLKWEEYSNDSVHPVDSGHEMISFIIENFLQLELDSPKDERTLLSKPMFKRAFHNPYYYDYSNLPTNDKGSFEKYDEYILLRNGFVSSGKQPMFFQLSAVKELFLMILYSNDPTAGTAIIEVNEEKKKINCYFKNGWGSKPLAVNVFSSEVPKDINVCIYPESEQTKIIVLRICKS